MPFAAQGALSLDLIRKTSDLSVRRQCELLCVNRSKVYYMPKSPDEEAIERKERIMALIDCWHTDTNLILKHNIQSSVCKQCF